MSTKIYDAYKVADGKIETVFTIKRDLEYLYEQYVIATLKRFSDVVTVDDYLDMSNVKPFIKTFADQKIKSMLPGDLQCVIKAVIDQRGRDPLNFEASMVLFSHKGNLYIQFFGLGSYAEPCCTYIQNLEKAGTILDFHYQNQTDPPDDIPEEEFENRGVIWDEILKENNSDVPGEIGFCYSFWNRGFSILYKFFREQRGLTETE